jgi:L-fuculose-phosphate aldolase
MNMDRRQELVQHYRWLRQYGINDSHSGNASFRDGNQFWITPTGACADTLTAEQLIACPLQGEIPQGASLDAPLHQKVYQTNPHSQAVLHSHGPHAIALTMNGEDYTPRDFEGYYYFDGVPVLSIDYDRYVEQAPEAVARALANHKAAIVAGHGVYVQAETINLAYKWSCSLESSARIDYLARMAATLPGSQ